MKHTGGKSPIICLDFSKVKKSFGNFMKKNYVIRTNIRLRKKKL